MSGWGCPHEIGGKCMRVKGVDCDPGMKGCVLFGRFQFSNEAKNRPSARRRSAGQQGSSRAQSRSRSDDIE